MRLNSLKNLVLKVNNYKYGDDGNDVYKTNTNYSQVIV